jgi:uncharacterized protein (TIRG00374 family)
MRKFVIGVIIIIAVAVVFLRGDSLVQLVETMETGSTIPLILAVIAQLGKYAAQSCALSFSFRTVGEHLTPRHTINLIFGQFFMNTIAPSLGTSGIMLVADDARRRNIPTGRATSAAILMQISIESGFGFIMLIGFTVLQITGSLDPLWFCFGLVVVFLVSFMTSILIVGRKNPRLLMRLFTPIENLLNRVLAKFKRTPMKPWAATLVEEFGDAAGRIAHNPKKALFVFLFSIIASSCELTCFILVGIAFGVTYPPALIGGYVIATLLAMISFTPQGVGFVEVGVLALMTAYGVSTAGATAVALVYRGLVFWMPFSIGAVLINRTKSFSKKSTRVIKDIAAEETIIPVGKIADAVDELDGIEKSKQEKAAHRQPRDRHHR